MIKNEYDSSGLEESEPKLKITQVGYLMMLMSTILTSVGILLSLAILYIPGMMIQFSYVYFLWQAVNGTPPEFNLILELPSNQVKAKQFLSLLVKFESDSINDLQLSLETSSGIFPVLKPDHTILIPAEQGGSSFILYTPRRGKEKIVSVYIAFGGIPGLFYFTSEIEIDIKIIVLPQPQRVQLPWTLKQKIFDLFISEISISRRGRGDSFLSLRDFEFGDELRNIHWKATAKWGKLITKEFEEPIQLRFLIVVDRSMLMAGPKLEFVLSSIIELASVIRTSNHTCTILIHGNQSTWQHNLGTSPSSLNRLSILLHSIRPEGTYFNFTSLRDYIKHHRLSDTVLIILSDLEQDIESVKTGYQILSNMVQRMFYFACYTPGFSAIDLSGKQTRMLEMDQYFFPNVILKSKVRIAYEMRKKEYSRALNTQKSKFHLIEGYNTNILLELRDSLKLMQLSKRSQMVEELS